MEDLREERKAKIKAWLSNKYNLALIGILIIALAIRLYYFFLTQNQPLWWDEAEYGLKAKSFAFGTPATGWSSERELIIPLFFSIIFKLGFGEIGIRFIQLLMSFATVFFTYILISKYLDKRKAVLATFFMSIFWLQLFFSQRILIYPWVPLLFLLMGIFFYKGYFENNKKWLYAFGAISAICLETYFSSGFFLFGVFTFIVLTERSNVFKRKDLWITLLVFLLFLTPFLIYSQITYGSLMPRLTRATEAMTIEHGPGLSMIFGFLTMMPRLIGTTMTILFALSVLFFIFELIIGFDIIFKNKDKNQLSKILIFLIFFWTLLFYTIFAMRAGSSAGEGFYDAFILSTFPFIFAFISDFCFSIKGTFDKYHKLLFPAFILVILFMYCLYQIPTTDATIKNKLTSYDSVEFGGIWINEHTQPGDIIISRSRPQNTYYSERETIGYPETEEEFQQLLKEKKPKYVIDSIWESTNQWIHEYPIKHNETVRAVQVYFLDEQRTQPSLIIYEVNNSNIS